MTSEAHVAWRLALGEEVCRAYATDGNVLATAIVGSVARGWAGGRIRHRLGGSAPRDWRAALSARDGLVGEMWPFQDDEFAEHFPVRGVAVGVSGFTAATIDAICDELRNCARAREVPMKVGAAPAASAHEVSRLGGPLFGVAPERLGEVA